MFFFLVRLREYQLRRDNQQHSRLRSHDFSVKSLSLITSSPTLLSLSLNSDNYTSYLLILSCISRFQLFLDAKGSYASDIFAVEVLGGGVRMQVVQQAVIDVMGEVCTLCSTETALPTRE